MSTPTTEPFIAYLREAGLFKEFKGKREALLAADPAMAGDTNPRKKAWELAAVGYGWPEEWKAKAAALGATAQKRIRKSEKAPKTYDPETKQAIRIAPASDRSMTRNERVEWVAAHLHVKPEDLTFPDSTCYSIWRFAHSSPQPFLRDLWLKGGGKDDIGADADSGSEPHLEKTIAEFERQMLESQGVSADDFEHAIEVLEGVTGYNPKYAQPVADFLRQFLPSKVA